MSSDIVQLADAIVDSLNASEVLSGATAVRRPFPLIDLSKIGEDTLVQVMPRSAEFSPASRTGLYVDIAIDIGVQRRMPKFTNDDVDELLALVERVGAYLHLLDFPDVGGPGNVARWLSMSNEPVYAPDHLLNFSVFTSVLTVTYRTLRKK